MTTPSFYFDTQPDRIFCCAQIPNPLNFQISFPSSTDNCKLIQSPLNAWAICVASPGFQASVTDKSIIHYTPEHDKENPNSHHNWEYSYSRITQRVQATWIHFEGSKYLAGVCLFLFDDDSFGTLGENDVQQFLDALGNEDFVQKVTGRCREYSEAELEILEVRRCSKIVVARVAGRGHVEKLIFNEKRLRFEVLNENDAKLYEHLDEESDEEEDDGNENSDEEEEDENNDDENDDLEDEEEEEYYDEEEEYDAYYDDNDNDNANHNENVNDNDENDFEDEEEYSDDDDNDSQNDRMDADGRDVYENDNDSDMEDEEEYSDDDDRMDEDNVYQNSNDVEEKENHFEESDNADDHYQNAYEDASDMNNDNDHDEHNDHNDKMDADDDVQDSFENDNSDDRKEHFAENDNANKHSHDNDHDCKNESMDADDNEHFNDAPNAQKDEKKTNARDEPFHGNENVNEHSSDSQNATVQNANAQNAHAPTVLFISNNITVIRNSNGFLEKYFEGSILPPAPIFEHIPPPPPLHSNQWSFVTPNHPELPTDSEDEDNDDEDEDEKEYSMYGHMDVPKVEHEEEVTAEELDYFKWNQVMTDSGSSDDDDEMIIVVD